MSPQVRGNHASSALLNITRRRSKMPCAGELFRPLSGETWVVGERDKVGAFAKDVNPQKTCFLRVPSGIGAAR
jgi:hypothetical protein